jgi:hypothetical protein
MQKVIPFLLRAETQKKALRTAKCGLFIYYYSLALSSAKCKEILTVFNKKSNGKSSRATHMNDEDMARKAAHCRAREGKVSMTFAPSSARTLSRAMIYRKKQ